MKHIVGYSVVSLLLLTKVSIGGERINTTTTDTTTDSSTISTNDEKKPVIKISGKMTAVANVFNSKRKGDVGKGQGNSFFVNDTRINFNVDGSTDATYGPLEYGLMVGITGDPDETRNVEEAYAKLKGEWGTFMLGSTYGPEVTAIASAYPIMGGTGGFYGCFDSLINMSSGTYLSSKLPGSPKYATKAIFYSPRVNGFQLGVGYTPNTQHKGGAKLKTLGSVSAVKESFDKNSWAGVLNYKNEFDNGLSLMLSLAGITAKGHSGNYGSIVPYNTNTVAVGGTVGYSNFKFGASYAHGGKTRMPNAYNGRGHSSVDVAAGYSIGPNSIAVGAYFSEVKYGKLKKDFGGQKSGQNVGDAKTNVYSLTLDRKLYEGLGVFIEGNYFDMKTTDTLVNIQNNLRYNSPQLAESQGVGNNHGYATMVGLKLSF